MLTLELPWPPSVNRYWRKWNNRMVISNEGRKYREGVQWVVGRQPINENRLCVSIEAYPPDNRRRDIDNVLKSLLDSMQHAGVYEDDAQIDRLLIERKEVTPPGKVIVRLRDLQDYPHHPDMHTIDGKGGYDGC